MGELSQVEKDRLIALIQEGKPLPLKYRSELFANEDAEYVEATKDYRLIYKGKMSKEAVLRTTPAAPLQQIRSFNADNPFDDDWRNMLIFGDNLLALKAIYNDQRGPNIYHTKNKIKLIYIDPPFATRQDFMKDREKAYRDKVIGAHFIEFLRRRLIIMHEILADDGAIYVHLDTKKSHYIKATLDEVFGEENFINEIVWKRINAKGNVQRKWGEVHESILFYARSRDLYIWNQITRDLDQKYVSEMYRYIEQDTGRRYRLSDVTAPASRASKGQIYVWRGYKLSASRCWVYAEDKMQNLHDRGILVYSPEGYPSIKRYLDTNEGEKIPDWWEDIKPSLGAEMLRYPTQKPEQLLERVIGASSNRGDIVMDAFAGSGTTAAIAEKMFRRWIAIDCGKLAIYTAQKRLLHLGTQIGVGRQQERREHERVSDFDAHSKATSRGLLLIYEKARRGDLNITDSLLCDLALFLEKHLSGNQKQEFSLVCPEAKFQVRELKVIEDNLDAGEKAVDVDKVRFLISFIQPKEKPEKPKPLKAKEFALYHAGIYDKDLILNLAWEQYRPFVLQLFGVREESHRIRGLTADGYIGLHSAYLWEYPNFPDLVLDRGYIQSLHEVMQGRGGDRFYVIAPGTVMAFMEDEITIGKTTYVILKVPLSVLMALIERGEAGSVKQPTNEASVNEVIDAVGYDFISQPIVMAKYTREKPSDEDLFNRKTRDYIIRLADFRSNTLASDPEDFAPFETFSMVLVDCDYDGETFNLSRVFWADDIINEGRTKAVVILAENEVVGENIMVIFMDKYGNELKVCKKRGDFKQIRQRRKVGKKTAKKK